MRSYNINDLKNKIICGDVLEELKKFPNESIDCVMTSPPYWALRTYLPEDHPNKEKEIGLEANPDVYLDKLLKVFDEIKRVLKKEGTVFVNLSDTYFHTPTGSIGTKGWLAMRGNDSLRNQFLAGKLIKQKKGKTWSYQQKCMCCIPERFVICMIERGWILRNKIVWVKFNMLPTSAKDRLSNKFEMVYFFVKNKKYYFDLDAIRKPFEKSTIQRIKSFFNNNEEVKMAEDAKHIPGRDQYLRYFMRYKGKFTPDDKKSVDSIYARQVFENKQLKDMINLKGANPGNVWIINTKGTKEKHFAVYPEELCVKPILAGSPPNGIVLDPFCGTGTTCVVAKKLGRNYVGIDISEVYCEIAKKRIEKECGGLL